VFAGDGQYTDRNRQNRTAFRKGDVYARHGSRSEPWNQADAAEARIRLVAREKEAWRAEQAELTRHLLQATAAQSSVVDGPADAFTWRLDAAGFEASTVELIRRGDDVPVRRMLRAAQADLAHLLQVDDSDAAEEIVTLLDRLTAVAAIALDLQRPSWLGVALDALLGVYDLGITRQDATSGRSSPWLWLRLAERLYALGALAVRLRDWESVRRIVVAPLRNLPPDQRDDRTWHRHAVTKASWAGLLQENTTTCPRPLSLLLFARAVATANPVLRPDLPGPIEPEPAGRDPLLTSACQFDFLATIISGTDAAAQHQLLDVSYPHYARYYGNRVRPAAAALVTDTGMRAVLLPGITDAQLARVLHLADELARAVARSLLIFGGWDGYDDVTAEFIVRALPDGASS
jgi:hypothetical protein